MQHHCYPSIFVLMLGIGLLSSTGIKAQGNTCPPFSTGVVNTHEKDRNFSNPVDLYKFRTIDGSYNNLRNPDWGMAEIEMRRRKNVLHFANDDGNTLVDRGNPRMISNLLCDQEKTIESDNDLSALVFTFLQFLDHDITLTESHATEFEPIPVPLGDPYFDPNYTGQAIIPFNRTSAIDGYGTPDNPRQNKNFITAWIDGSAVYGSDDKRAQWLRSGEFGKLKSYKSPYGELLPCNTTTGDCHDPIDPTVPFMAGNQDQCGELVKVFVAGDLRANEQVGLTAMHTIFLREHNRICEDLKSKGHTDDEWNYQYARKLVGGMIQAITYGEALPALGLNFETFKYKSNNRPDIFNEFATAAYRLGHTMITEEVPMYDAECNDAKMIVGCNEETVGVFGGANCSTNCTYETKTGAFTLKDAFFNPSIIANNGIDEILRGLSTQTQQKMDTRVTNSVRNFLFGQPGLGGLDLAALNIQRGRDHGLPDYNTTRSLYGLEKVNSFEDITSNTEISEALQSTYESVDNIDLWVGLLSEDYLDNKVLGPTLYRMLKFQFTKIRNGDRFYFEIDRLISPKDREFIRSTKLADIIARNSDVNLAEAFKPSPCSKIPTYCEVSSNDSSTEWIEEVHFGDFHNKSGNDGGYGDYTSEIIDFKTNSYVPVVLKAGYTHHKYVENWKVWIDWNGNGIFDSTEIVFLGRRRNMVKGYLHIPGNALPGRTRMRISLSYYPHLDPCMHIAHGEIEDYTINIIKEDNGHRVNPATKPNVDIKAEKDDITITPFPNPTLGQSTIRFYSKYDQSAKMTIVHISGKEVHRSELDLRKGENYIDIDGMGYKAGLYTIFVDFERTGRKSTKLVVHRK